MLAILRRPKTPRRGVTLVEMLVVVALVVLMMTILVQIFQSATGAMSSSRTIQELDQSLRLLDTTLRQDLQGATARFTPPLNPVNNLGYFEYGENVPADFQGEDSDDYLAWTSRAPEGQVFTGRQWLGGNANSKVQPTTITSNVAEVIYFLRNGNLYRRTFLVVPERVMSIESTSMNNNYNFVPYMFGSPVYASWLGMNDISARPSGYSQRGSFKIIPTPNTLGDLTNRENRAFRPRFTDDFSTANDTTNPPVPDGVPDDNNGDDLPDYYPTLYYDGGKNNGSGANWRPNGHVVEPQQYTTQSRISSATSLYDVYAFPFIYPGMYSVPSPYNSGLGWLHQMYPNSGVVNHSPLESGDTYQPMGRQTWFGFPTWRETMTGVVGTTTRGWTDPILAPNKNIGTYQQSNGLQPFNPTTPPNIFDLRFLPPVVIAGTTNTPPFSDGAGSASFALTKDIYNTTLQPGTLWEEDLILTNVRSFDVKAYDPDAPLYGVGTGYRDLGYANLPTGLDATSYSNSTYYFQLFGQEPKGFGHEGRIPPYYDISAKLSDFRANPRRASSYGDSMNYQVANGNTIFDSPIDVGDPSPGVIRLRRVFDTWSTAYTNAPESDIYLHGLAPAPPIYPSFPPPYPSPLRGIQIQIRVADPRNERVKVLTIRQDFTDKL